MKKCVSCENWETYEIGQQFRSATRRKLKRRRNGQPVYPFRGKSWGPNWERSWVLGREDLFLKWSWNIRLSFARVNCRGILVSVPRARSEYQMFELALRIHPVEASAGSIILVWSIFPALCTSVASKFGMRDSSCSEAGIETVIIPVRNFRWHRYNGEEPIHGEERIHRLRAFNNKKENEFSLDDNCVNWVAIKNEDNVHKKWN